MVLEFDPGRLGRRHPLRYLDERSVGTLDNQEHPVRPLSQERMNELLLYRGDEAKSGLVRMEAGCP